MTEQQNVHELLDRLEQLGLPTEYVRSLLPEWWDDTVAAHGSGLTELKLILSRQFGLEAMSLLQDKESLEYAIPANTKFKRSIRYGSEEITPSASMAIACAQIAAAATPQGIKTPQSPNQIRKYIFEHLGGKWVSLRGLLTYCWDSGIPVLYLDQYPVGMKKMDGMVAMVDDRPVIVISKTIRFSAWLLFILAHELGHIALGHTHEGEILIDETLDKKTFLNTEDEEERAADDFAMELLNGGFELPAELLQIEHPIELAREAVQIGKGSHVDAGHLLLRYAYQKNGWRQAITALDIIENGRPATTDIKTIMAANMQMDLIPEDSYLYLIKMAGIQLREQGEAGDHPAG